MANKRKLIRTAAVSLLSGNTAAGTNVFDNRVTRFWREELPAISVFTRQETATKRDVSGRQSIRVLELQIEVRAEGDEAVDDTLDDICEQIENIIEENQSINGLAHGTVLTNTEIELDADGEKLIGIATLNFEVRYIE